MRPLHHFARFHAADISAAANLANLYGSLKQCMHLRELGLVCNLDPTDVVGFRPFLFLDTLADLLSPTDAPSPFPRFEALSLELLQTNELVLDGCEDACTKLASALEDRTRYPHLKRLDVCAKTQKHTGTIEGYIAIRGRLVEEEAIFRTSFGRVEAVGVRVEISME